MTVVSKRAAYYTVICLLFLDTLFSIRKWYIMRSLAAIESGAGGPTVLHPLVTEDQPSLLSHVRCSNIDLRGFPKDT